MKPDALSRLLSTVEEEADPEPVLPAACNISAVSWEIETLIREAQETELDPGTGPPGRLFVPAAVLSQVIQCAHTARFSCHPHGPPHHILFAALLLVAHFNQGWQGVCVTLLNLCQQQTF